MLEVIGSILIISLFSAVIMISEHYVPWGKYISGRDAHPVVNYVSGILGILIPFTALVLYQRGNAAFTPLVAALALWIITVVSGITVLLCHWIDKTHSSAVLIHEAKERERLYRESINSTDLLPK
jgi:tellurite resistance protein TehA-like permease